jgi:hypothetical protein
MNLQGRPKVVSRWQGFTSTLATRRPGRDSISKPSASEVVMKLGVVTLLWKKRGKIQCCRHGTTVARHVAEGGVPGEREI